MTEPELRAKFGRDFNITTKWPKTYEVDADTYANVCQVIFIRLSERLTHSIRTAKVMLGSNNGIMWKGVELILKSK